MIHCLSCRILSFVVLLCLSGVGSSGLKAQESSSAGPANLAVLWTSGDSDVAHRVAFLYTLNAKKQSWFDEVTLIVWGPSQRLLAADSSIQDYVKEMQAAGVVVEACINCSEAYGITETIKALGIEVKPMGSPLSDYLKHPNWATISF
ncbi:MAG: DsrE family protein [Verrucomicrobiales bacterium]